MTTTADERLAELMLHIAERSEGDEKFGATKLNKILFFADFIAYAHYGVPITGQEYKRRPFGPCPRRLTPVRTGLIESGRAALKTIPYRGKAQKKLVALDTASLSDFNGDQIAVVDFVIDSLWDYNATDATDLSHRFEGWKHARSNEEIPYETVFLSSRPLTDTEMEWASALEPSREVAA